LIKPTGSVRFRFYKPETEKTESKPEKTEPNRFEPVFVQKTEPKPVGLNRFRFFKKKNRFGYFFFNKNRTEPKMITPTTK
jgi:hypothetical protein